MASAPYRPEDEDDTRDELCTALKNLGLNAQMAARGRVEEKIYFGPRRSLGVIDIAEGPIRWVNVTEETSTWGGGDDPDFLDFVVYGVPDSRVGPGFPEVRLKAVWVKTFPGQITGVRWKGEDFGLGIVDRLSQDVSLASAMLDGAKLGNNWHPETSTWRVEPGRHVKNFLNATWWFLGYVGFPRRVPRMEIRAYPYPSCWMLTTPTLAPSKQEWDCYQAVAQHLLAMPIPTGE